MYRKIDVFSTFSAAWLRYKSNAGLYGLMVLLLIVLMIPAAFTMLISPVLMIVVQLFMGLLLLGFAHTARADQLGETVSMGKLFAAFSSNIGKTVITLIVVNAVSLVLLWESTMQSFAVMAEAGGLLTGATSPADFAEMNNYYTDNPMGASWYILVAIYAWTFLTVFATYRSTLDGKNVIEALKDSALGVFKNFFSLIGFYLLLIVMFLVVVFVLALLIALLAALSAAVGILLGIVVYGVLVFVGLPWMMMLTYDLYEQIFGEEIPEVAPVAVEEEASEE